MFTWGSKYFFGLSAATFVAAIIYVLVSGGGLLGALSLGWYQGVGVHTGFAVLMGLTLALFLLGVLSVWVRDAEAEEAAILVGGERVPQALPPVNPSFWGVVTGFAVGALLIGASVSDEFLLLGAALLVVVALEWAVLSWTDRATGDPAANRTIRNRIMMPIEVPLFGALAIAVLALGVSRLFLAVSATGSVIVASVLATVGFLMAVAFVYRPRWFSGNTLSGLVAAFGGLILVGGVVAAAVGPREFEHHVEEHAEEPGEEVPEGDPLGGEGEVDGLEEVPGDEDGVPVGGVDGVDGADGADLDDLDGVAGDDGPLDDNDQRVVEDDAGEEE